MDVGLLKIVKFEVVGEVVTRAYLACMPESEDHKSKEVD